MRLFPLVAALATATALASPPTSSAARPAAAPAFASAPASAPALATAAAAVAPPARQVSYRQWDGPAQWGAGTFRGTGVRDGRLVLTRPRDRRTHAGRVYDQGGWSSPWVRPGFGITELIPSWSALTPGDSWAEVLVRGRLPTGRMSSWDVLGRWTSGDRHLRRTTVSGQTDDLGRVATDTWRSTGAAGVTAYQVKLRLLRRAGTTAAPSADTVGAVASRLPSGRVATSAPGPARGVVLDVPRASQMVHSGHYPAWGGGGEAWCSPTATSMVLAYYRSLPRPASYRWVPAGHPDPWVDHAARMTYDHAYRGTGNWAFNTAYAAPRAGKAFVTRLRSLREAERYVAAGIPLVASISFGRGQLDGAPIGSSAGHLLVIVGFTRSGDVVVNDPAARTRVGVRRTYDRGQLENAWLPTSGGTVYVIRDAAHPLP